MLDRWLISGDRAAHVHGGLVINICAADALILFASTECWSVMSLALAHSCPKLSRCLIRSRLPAHGSSNTVWLGRCGANVAATAHGVG